MKKSSIHSMQDARNLAKKRLPSMIFDYVDGVALEADGYHSNAEYLKSLCEKFPIYQDIEEFKV